MESNGVTFILQLPPHLKAGAGFGGKLAVAVEGGCGKLLLELFHQTAELLPLGGSISVSRYILQWAVCSV